MGLRVSRILSAGILVAAAAGAFAQPNPNLQITEVLFDSVDGNESNWEWMEIYNSGTTDIDLDGYWLEDSGASDHNPSWSPNIVSVASGGSAPNTIVPAGSTAVLYNGFRLGYDDDRFRNAWQMPANTSLIAVDFAPSYNNGGGDIIGLYSGADGDGDGLSDSYHLDTADTDGDAGTVERFCDDFDDGLGNVTPASFPSCAANAAAAFDYRGYAGDVTGSSIHWNGSGNYQDLANWANSAAGMDGVRTSVMTNVPGSTGSVVNSSDDFGTPMAIPGGTAPSGLVISELMYDPNSSPEGNWEWVELYNNSGAAIDFGATPMILDDSSGTLTAANITSGSVGNGEIAILVSDSADLSQFNEAWGAGPDGVAGTGDDVALNVISVSDWSALSNGGDTVTIWPGADAAAVAAYTADRTAGTTDNALVSLAYDDDGTIWPDSGNSGGSLEPFGLDLFTTDANGTNVNDINGGLDWFILAPGDGSGGYNAAEVVTGEPVVDHEGGDTGSPGEFGMTTGGEVDGDFNDDMAWDCGDIDALMAEIAAGTDNADFDLTGDGVVDTADRDAWLAEGATENGFGSPFFLGDANLDGFVDVSDLNIWSANKFSSSTDWCLGNFNGDGFVDVSDLNIWNSTKFSSSDAVNAVPEPTAAMLLLFGGLGLMIRRRR